MTERKHSPSDERASEESVHFLIHNEGDHVAVAVRDVAPGRMLALFMDSGRELWVTVSEQIPMGHKVAINDLAAEREVIEYGVPIGLSRGPIKSGELVHIHNVRSRRWQTSV